MQVHSNLILHKSSLFFAQLFCHGSRFKHSYTIRFNPKHYLYTHNGIKGGGLVNLPTLLITYKHYKETLNTLRLTRLELTHGSTYTNYFLDYI